MRILKKELWPYKIKVNGNVEHGTTDIEIWLGKQLGTFKGRWNVVYQYNETHFYFRNEQDATLFALRWA
jgi:hypothetical protein